MPIIEKLRRVRLFYATLGMLAVAATSTASAEGPLRWKFQKGAKYNYDTIQDTTIGSTGGPGGPQSVTMHQELKMTWEIQDVTKDGDAVIQQKLENAKMKMALPPPVGAIEYDSASDKPAVGPAAMLAPMYTAMMKGAFVITMSPRGEITDVKIPAEVLAALKNSPGAAAMGDMASPKGLKTMMQQGLPEFSEEGTEQKKEWTKTVEVDNAAGKQVLETTYRYKGNKEVEGVQFAEFQPTTKVKFEGAVKISEQTSDGEILFNVAEGRLASSKIEQHVTIEQPGGGQTKIDQNILVTLKPAGEESSEKKSVEAAATPATEETK